jgi:hypothetical protein
MGSEWPWLLKTRLGPHNPCLSFGNVHAAETLLMVAKLRITFFLKEGFLNFALRYNLSSGNQ